MKKFWGLLVLMMFLISILPLALAEDTNTTDTGDDTDEAEEVEVELELEEDIAGTADSAKPTLAAMPATKKIKIMVRARTTTECIDELTNEYPNAVPARIRTACAAAFASINKPRVVHYVISNAPDNATLVDNVMVIARRLSNIQSVKAQNILQALPEKADVLKNFDRARLKWCVDNVEECRDKIKNYVVKTVKVKNLLRVRDIAKEKLQAANQAFEHAKNKYKNAKHFQQKARNEFNDLKKQLKECQDSGQDCSELEADLLEKAKENLIGIADRLIQHLEKVKSGIESAENMDEEEAQEAIAEIDALIAELEAAKEEVEAVTNKEELDQAAKTIRDIWRKLKHRAFRYAERVIHSHLRGIFVRSEMLEKKLEKVLDRLEAKGVDISDLEDLLDQFSSYIDEARDKLKQADELFDEAKVLRADGDIEGAKDALEQAKTLLREAHEALKNAHRVLMQLVKEINQSGESFDPEEIDEEEEIEVVEEVEEEEEDNEEEENEVS